MAEGRIAGAYAKWITKVIENLDSAHQSASGRADSFQKVASVRIALTNFHAVLFTIQRISVYIV